MRSGLQVTTCSLVVSATITARRRATASRCSSLATRSAVVSLRLPQSFNALLNPPPISRNVVILRAFTAFVRLPCSCPVPHPLRMRPHGRRSRDTDYLRMLIDGPLRHNQCICSYSRELRLTPSRSRSFYWRSEIVILLLGLCSYTTTILYTNSVCHHGRSFVYVCGSKYVN